MNKRQKKNRQNNTLDKTATEQGELGAANATDSGHQADVDMLSKAADGAWITGLVGAISVVLVAFVFFKIEALNHGISFAGKVLTTERNDSMLVALALVAVAMLIAECVRLYLQGNRVFQFSKQATSRTFSDVFFDAFVHYVELLILLAVVMFFFHTAGEYGFKRGAAFYQIWFRFLDLAWMTYLYAGLPYLLFAHYVTGKSPTFLHRLMLGWLKGRFFSSDQAPEDAKELQHRFRVLLIKMVFLPLMLVFFAQNFNGLVGFMGYFTEGLPSLLADNVYDHGQLNRDAARLAVALLFSIDFALAWCAYLLSMRWLGNGFLSSDATIPGWLVCLLSFAPYKLAFSWYFYAPGDMAFLKLADQTLLSVIVVVFVLMHVLNTLSVASFGLRFSNLGYRGVIRSGVFAFVRHPGYAAKNIAWWCVGLPVMYVAWQNSGIGAAVKMCIGLALISVVYYVRAITEERHLRQFAEYRDYCEQVRYRFIPRLF